MLVIRCNAQTSKQFAFKAFEIHHSDKTNTRFEFYKTKVEECNIMKRKIETTSLGATLSSAIFVR